MAYEKGIIIGGSQLAHGTGVKESIEKSQADTQVCFDEAIAVGSDTVTYKLSIDRLVYETLYTYRYFSNMFEQMLNRKKDISIYETIRFKNQKPYLVTKHYHGCILDGADYEMKPEELSTQNLSFICESREIVYEEINE